MEVQHIGFSFLSVQKSKFWLKKILPEKVAKTTKKRLCVPVSFVNTEYFVLSLQMKTQSRISNIHWSFHANTAVL